MSNTYHGDNAFPATEDSTTGLSKREYFAGRALQGIISKPHQLEVEEVAAIAVKYADALISALNKPKEEQNG